MATRRFNPRTGKIEVVGRDQRVQVPTGLGVGTTRSLGRSGTVQTATRSQVRQFQQQQAETRTPQKIPKPVQEQAALAGKALGDPDLPKRISFQQQAPTVRTGRSGTLQQAQPGPELFIGDAPASAEALKGRPFIPGDEGTRIILSEVTRRGREKGVSDDEILGATQQLAQRAGLKGFTAKRSTLGNIIGGKTLGIPNALLVPIAAAASSGAFGAQAGGSQAAGTAVPTSGGAGFIGPPVQGLAVSPSAPGVAAAGTVPTAGGAGFIGPPVRGLTVSPSSAAAGVVPTAAAGRGAVEAARNIGIRPTGVSNVGSVAKNIQRGFDAATRISKLLGGRGGTTGGAPGAQPGQPQIVFLQPQVVQPRQTTVAGALPAFARRNRDRFGGTRTASLFASRGEQFQSRRRRSTLLGGR